MAKYRVKLIKYDDKVAQVIPSDVQAHCNDCGKVVKGIIRGTLFVCRKGHQRDVSPKS